jgi:hypothetical protein
MIIEGKTIIPHASGLYYMGSRTTLYGPLGQTKQVPNPNKKWFEFWKPKTITSPVIMPVQFSSGSATLQLEAYVEYHLDDLMKSLK